MLYEAKLQPRKKIRVEQTQKEHEEKRVKKTKKEVISQELEETEEKEDTEGGARIFIFRHRVTSSQWEHICSLSKMKRGLRWYLKLISPLINLVHGCWIDCNLF